MGTAVYAIFERSIDEARDVDGKVLATKLESLDAYAMEQGLEPLSAFISLSPEMRDLAIAEGVDDAALPPVEWFDAEQGLRTVRALRASEHGRDSGLDSDLAALERAFGSAKTRGVRFHMVVDV